MNLPSLFLSVCLFLSIQALPAQYPLNDIDDLVNEALQTFNVPGAALCIVQDDRVILSRGYGTKDISTGQPVTENTLFNIASCTKAFTAFILGQLVDEGLLAWDDLVIKHIPEFRLINPELSAEATIRDLLAHRIGLARHDPVWFFSTLSSNDVINILPHLELASGFREKFHYNNLLYTVAGMLIERTTGQTWDESVSSRIFIPLGMDRSTTFLEEVLASQDFSQPYAEINGTIEKIPFHDVTSVKPGAGVNSSISDLAKWVQLNLSKGSLNNRFFIKEETLNEMYTFHIASPQTQPYATNSGYGLGWDVEEFRGQKFVSHLGNCDGFTSKVIIIPEKNIGVALLTNSSSDGRQVISYIAHQVIDRLLGYDDIDWKNYARQVHSMSKYYLWQIEENQANKTPSSPHIALKNFAGSYFHRAYGTVNITVESNELLVSYKKFNFPLSHQFETTFLGKFEDLLYFGISPYTEFYFPVDAEGNITQLKIGFEKFRSYPSITFKKQL